MRSQSIFINTHCKSYLPSNDFIEAWKRRLEENGYEKGFSVTDVTIYEKDQLEVAIVDARGFGKNLANQFVEIQYRVRAAKKTTIIHDDIPLEEFEKKANEILKEKK